MVRAIRAFGPKEVANDHWPLLAHLLDSTSWGAFPYLFFQIKRV